MATVSGVSPNPRKLPSPAIPDIKSKLWVNMFGIFIQRKTKNKRRIKDIGSPSQTSKKRRLPKKKAKRKMALNRTFFLNPDFISLIISKIIATANAVERIN